MKSFLERLKDEVLVCDGAMGTMLTGGQKVHFATEELNVNGPSRIREVHQAYIDAGAQIIETNTFGANEISLKKCGLEDKVEEINRAGVALAKGVVGDKDVYVAGSVGPVDGHGSQAVYERQICALISAGVDAIILETMGWVDEALEGISAVRAISKDIPVIVQVAPYKNFTTKSGVDVETFMRILNDQPVDVVGLNCFLGPKHAYQIFQQLSHWTNKPLSMQPNIGEVTFSEQDIDYEGADLFERYTRKFIAAGARIVGGCCGTTPKQVKTIARVVAERNAQKIFVQGVPKKDACDKIVLAQQDTRLKEMFHRAKNDVFPIVEIDPPLLGELQDEALKLAERLERMCNGYIAFTVGDNPGAIPRMDKLVFAGLLQKVIPSYVPIVVHLSCRDLTMIAAESVISGIEALKIHNVLAITGDPPAKSVYDKSIAVNNFQSISLLRLFNERNHARNAVGEQVMGRNEYGELVVMPSKVYLGCAFDCGKFETEKLKLETKYRAGANFALTQIISDVKTVERLAEYVQEAQKTRWGERSFYVIPGVYLFRSRKNMEFMQEMLNIKINPQTIERMANCKTLEEQRACGYQIAKFVILAAKQHFPAVYVVPPAKNPELIIPLMKETGLIR